MTDLAQLFGRRVNAARKQQGLTGAELAAKAGVPVSTLNNILGGHNEPLLGLAVAVAGALGLSLDALAAPSPCATCDGMPPPPFTCPDCGAGGAAPGEVAR